MRKSRLLIAGVAVAAAGVATSAFTAGNTVPDSVAGYGQGSVTGAEVTTIHYVSNTDDASIVDAVKFVTTTDLTGATSTLVLRSGAAVDGDGNSTGGDVYRTFDCATWDLATKTLTCDTTDALTPVLFADFNSVGLTVVS